MVTCYDFTSACIVQASGIDMVLVGDSAAMVMHGFDTTLPISVRQMARHVAAVRRGAPDKFIIGDMPFLSFRKGTGEAMNAVERLMKAGANAVKIEGIQGQEDLVRHIVDSGVPVMGHLGLTPQSVHQLGGYRVQGRSDESRERISRDALACERAGCFALVLECVPGSLAARITGSLTIPTIGIGAGRHTDGQVLVLQDMLGLNRGMKPRFVRRYADGYGIFLDALNHFAEDVKNGEFPASEERYAG